MRTQLLISRHAQSSGEDIHSHTIEGVFLEPTKERKEAWVRATRRRGEKMLARTLKDWVLRTESTDHDWWLPPWFKGLGEYQCHWWVRVWGEDSGRRVTADHRPLRVSQPQYHWHLVWRFFAVGRYMGRWSAASLASAHLDLRSPKRTRWSCPIEDWKLMWELRRQLYIVFSVALKGKCQVGRRREWFLGGREVGICTHMYVGSLNLLCACWEEKSVLFTQYSLNTIPGMVGDQ